MLTHGPLKFSDQYSGPHKILEICNNGHICITYRNSFKVAHPNWLHISHGVAPSNINIASLLSLISSLLSQILFSSFSPPFATSKRLLPYRRRCLIYNFGSCYFLSSHYPTLLTLLHSDTTTTHLSLVCNSFSL